MAERRVGTRTRRAPHLAQDEYPDSSQYEEDE
jgi:hypothetical protein